MARQMGARQERFLGMDSQQRGFWKGAQQRGHARTCCLEGFKKGSENKKRSLFLLIIEGSQMGRQHPSPNVKTLCTFELLDKLSSREHAKSAWFRGSRMSCNAMLFDIFADKFGPKKITSHDGCFLLIRRCLAREF